MREIGHFVGGKSVKGGSGRFGDVFDPNTGEVQAKVALAKRSEVEAAIGAAQAAQPGWAATNPQRRASTRTNGVNASASTNDTAGGSKIETLKGIMFRD